MRQRARLVCTQCHSRKVRCDLQDRGDSVCKNCQRARVECRVHVGSRARRSEARRLERETTARPQLETVNPQPILADIAPEQTAASDQSPHGYIGDASVLAYPLDAVPVGSSGNTSFLPDEVNPSLRSTGALDLPPPPLANALVDFFFDKVFSFIPAIDREDIARDDAPLLLRQSVYFAGSMMRRPLQQHRPFSTRDLYIKVKILLTLQPQNDPLVTLKALCMVGSWSTSSPETITLDCPWQWTGSAIRLALQLGLHREATYSHCSSPKCCRRIMWHLFISDTLQATCYGRPPMLRLQDMNVELPTAEAFNGTGSSGDTFCGFARLCTHISRIGELAVRRQDINRTEHFSLVDSLRSWMHGLPSDLQLYHENGRRKHYRRPVAELFIFYFSSIMLISLLPGQPRQSQAFHAASILASSYVARLYEEILLHEDVQYLLAIHGWTCLIAAVCQIFCGAKFPAYSNACAEELDILRGVLMKMRDKYSSAAVVLGKIDRLVHADITRVCAGNYFPDSASSTGGEDAPALASLFPLPNDVSAKINLLLQERVEAATTGQPDSLHFSSNLDDLSWPLDVSNFSVGNLDSLFHLEMGLSI